MGGLNGGKKQSDQSADDATTTTSMSAKAQQARWQAFADIETSGQIVIRRRLAPEFG